MIGRHFDVRLTAAYISLHRLVFLLDASRQAEGEHHPHKLEHGTRLREYIDSGSHYFAVVLIGFIPLPAPTGWKKSRREMRNVCFCLGKLPRGGGGLDLNTRGSLFKNYDPYKTGGYKELLSILADQ